MAGSDSYGIKVSKDGEDVRTTDPLKLNFSSKYPTPLVHKQGTATLTFPYGLTIATTDITHTLGYIPVAIGFVEDVIGQVTMMSAIYNNNAIYSIYSFSNKIILYGEDFYRTSSSPEVTKNCYYYILIDQVL